jgi:AcrR family transcriptional regulator
MEANSTDHSDRRLRVLDAAIVTFSRYGFRKTSMDEVARAAEISRQGLYLYFRNKDDLFREAMQKLLDDGLETVELTLSQPGVSIEDRLVAAMDAWFGRQLELLGGDATDLLEHSSALPGDMFSRYCATFQERLEAAISGSELAQAVGRQGLSSADVAETLYRCAVGWKRARLTRAEFLGRITTAVQVVCRRAPSPAVDRDGA